MNITNYISQKTNKFSLIFGTTVKLNNKQEYNKSDIPLFINQPKGTEEVVHITDIIVPEEFQKTRPLPYKLERCQRLYYKLKRLDKPITVIAETNEHGRPNKFVLVDGYSRYLFAKEVLKEQYMPVKYQDINTYIIRD